MVILRCRLIAIAVLALFLASHAAWSFDVLRISHELQHVGQAVHVSVVGDDAHTAADTNTDRADDRWFVSDEEHELLHAAVPIQAAVRQDFMWQPQIKSGAIRAVFVQSALAHAAREAPFRPPRSLRT